MNVVPITEQPQDEVTVCFDTFWAVYTRREAKKRALIAWAKLTPVQQQQAIVGAVAWRKTYIARGSEFTPLPATFLNDWRFEDELPADNVPTHASHVQAQSTPLPERGQIPPDVLQRIKQIMGSRK